MPSPSLSPAAPNNIRPLRDPVLLHAHAAMASMLQHGLPPTPANYLVWYSFHSGEAAGLKPVLDGYIAACGGGGIAQAQMDDLYARFFAAELEARSLQEVAQRLAGAVGEAVGLVRDAHEDALRYGGTLDQASHRLAAEPEALGVLLRRLVEETREVSRRSEAAVRNLAETSRKTQALQSELAEARHQASTDPLTGLANRRLLDESLRRDLAERRPLALVMVDLDHFKAVNDLHGHPTGDQVLCRLAHILTEVAGKEALVARFGGEEFAVLLREGVLRDAVQVAERIRARIAYSAMPIRQNGAPINVTASLGLAMANPGEAAAHLIERADAALYDAKRAGRNRVVSDPPQPKAESVWS